jgi:Electron transfer DM13
MNTRKYLIALIVLIAVVALWAAFRPERLVVNAKVNESFSTSTSAGVSDQVVASGRFHGVAHGGTGLAEIHKLTDGKRILRLTTFDTSNGPELQLYLVAANDTMDSEAVKKAGFVTLGALKGNQGDQNYDIPADVDLTKYRSVTVWCRRFGVNFATAPLSSGQASAAAPTPIFAGSFHKVLHDGSGNATIYRLPDGKRVLRFTEFNTSNGPDLQVYLVAAQDASDSSTVRQVGFVTLGALKGNQGDQNYEVPADVDLTKYKAVSVWCRRFSANFITAPLAPKA